MNQKIRREISGGVFRAIFDLRLHLVVDILNFEPFVTRVTDMDAAVKIQNRDRIYFSVREITLLNELKHPNIVELMAICPEKEKLYLIFEFMSMDLKQYLDITKS